MNARNPDYSSVDGILFNKRQTVLIQFPSIKAGNYTIPNGVNEIERSAFQSCTRVTSVTFPKSVKKIGDQGFYLCSLKAAYFQGNAPTVGGMNVFSGDSLIVYRRPFTWGWRYFKHYVYPNVVETAGADRH